MTELIVICDKLHINYHLSSINYHLSTIIYYLSFIAYQLFKKVSTFLNIRSAILLVSSFTNFSPVMFSNNSM